MKNVTETGTPIRIYESSLEDNSGRQSKTIWMTGLSGAGKSTLAIELEKTLQTLQCHCVVLDGDKIRTGLCKGLGFSKEDRIENIRRIAEVAKLFNQAGVVVIAALIAPYEEQRQLAKDIIGTENYVEVYISTPLEECERRDPKGLYLKARTGELAYFTGVSAPYEVPLSPALVLDTSALEVGACMVKLLAVLR